MRFGRDFFIIRSPKDRRMFRSCLFFLCLSALAAPLSDWRQVDGALVVIVQQVSNKELANSFAKMTAECLE
jgi:hypothetical protein